MANKKVGFTNTSNIQGDKLILNNPLTLNEISFIWDGLDDIEFKFPLVDGASGSALITDGLGNLSFGAPLSSGDVTAPTGGGISPRVAYWDGSNSLNNTDVEYAVGQLLFPSGSLMKPGISFRLDDDTGIIRSGSNQIGIVGGGSLLAEFKSNGVKTGGVTYTNVVGSNGQALTIDGSGNTSWSSFTGEVGPTGATGSQGVTGPTGAQGPIGPQGVTGNDGVSNIPGPIGPTGPKGDKGDDSVVPGPIGPIGPIGPQGATGNDGVSNIPGPIGPTGATGPQGATGGVDNTFQHQSGVVNNFIGSPLYKDVSFIGSFSATYSINIDSEAVRDWSISNKTTSGFRINSNSATSFIEDVYWSALEINDSGMGSIIGPQGPIGATGPKGDTGPQGVTGNDGVSNIPGPTGATGPKGDKGDIGPIGATGPKGDTGNDGVSNIPGPTGATGPEGPINIPTQTTGLTIAFTQSMIYNTPSSPATGNISHSLTGANIGIIQKIYHNNSTEPTYPGTWVKLGDKNYIINSLNIIYVEYVSPTRCEYWIVNN